MRQELTESGYNINVVAINAEYSASSQGLLAAECSFDLLQDTSSVNAWSLLGGGKDDMFVYRQGGRLAPSGYLPIGGEVNTVLSTPDGYDNVLNAIIVAYDLGPAEESCAGGSSGGWQIPGNVSQDQRLTLADVIVMLLHLYSDSKGPLPCEPDSLTREGNLALFDVTQDGAFTLADPVYLLKYIFQRFPPPPAGTECVQIEGCPDACAP